MLNLSYPSIRSTQKLVPSKFVVHSVHKDVRLWTKQCAACHTAKKSTQVQTQVRVPEEVFDVRRHFEHNQPLNHLGGRYTHRKHDYWNMCQIFIIQLNRNIQGASIFNVKLRSSIHIQNLEDPFNITREQAASQYDLLPSIQWFSRAVSSEYENPPQRS